MRIVVISHNYPSPLHSWHGTFVHELMKELVRQGAEIVVISPLKIWDIIKSRKIGLLKKQDDTLDGIRVLRPIYISFSNKEILKWFSTARISHYFFWLSVKSVLKKIKEFNPDVVYSHFLYPSGKTALSLSQLLDAPVLVSLGESSFYHEKYYSKEQIKLDLDGFDSVITVSNQLKCLITERFGIYKTNIVTYHNAVDTDRFRPLNKVHVRNKLGLPKDKIILIFIGSFDERKGSLRVIESIKGLKDVGIIFLGSGLKEPFGLQVLFKGRVSPIDVSDYLGASDIMVLPTLAEGMSNALLEGMACGLPIISSDLPFNHEFLDASFSILVDPLNIDEIRAAIKMLASNPEKRNQMSTAARNKALTFSISGRAKKIMGLISDILNRPLSN